MTLELTDQQLDDYLHIALANGFSKGTANVSPADMRKLRPLLSHYAKKPHPFRACVRDNRKRFGPRTNAVCAVLKDLIKGTTKWRGNEKNLSEDEDFVAFASNIPDEFYAWLHESTEDDVKLWLEDYNGDVALDRARQGMSEQPPPPEAQYHLAENPAQSCGTCEYFDGTGHCSLYDAAVQADYVSRGWEQKGVGVGLSEGQQALAEIFLADASVEEEDGLLWKTVLREGTWKYSPSPDGPQMKPMTIIGQGKSDGATLTVSMSELVENFEKGVIEHVTVPLSHEDRVDENTGFVRKLKMEKDSEGKWRLKAGLEFTEPEIYEKAKRGTIANTSGGILFDHIHKESGDKFGSVLGHVALTNRPWLNGMEPFGVKMGEDVRLLAFSEEIRLARDTDRGGEKMGDENKDETELQTQLTLAQEENANLREELERRRKADRGREIAGLVTKWENEHKAPAVVALAQELLTGEKGDKLFLSENGKRKELALADAIERLVDASPSLDLADEDKDVKDKDLSLDKPEDDETKEVELSDDIRREASKIWLSEGLSEDAAIAEAKKRLGKTE